MSYAAKHEQSFKVTAAGVKYPKGGKFLCLVRSQYPIDINFLDQYDQPLLAEDIKAVSSGTFSLDSVEPKSDGTILKQGARIFASVSLKSPSGDCYPDFFVGENVKIEQSVSNDFGITPARWTFPDAPVGLVASDVHPITFDDSLYTGCKVVVRADPNNTEQVWIGSTFPELPAAPAGYPLFPGDSFVLDDMFPRLSDGAGANTLALFAPSTNLTTVTAYILRFAKDRSL